jgi:hypothetical protein
VSAVPDFWLSSGHHLLDRDADGKLTLTDEFLKAYLARPELAPPPDACVAEQGLYRALLNDPRRSVSTVEIDVIADDDARENWRHMIAFRDHLLTNSTIEDAYLALIREGTRAPLLFLDQLVHVILRNVLDQAEDAYLLRAAEMFFRPQRLTIHEGSLIAADEEHVGAPTASPLVAMLGLPPASNIDVLNNDNAASYFERSDRFDMAFDLSAGRRGLAALGEVIERWVKHLLGVAITVAPLSEPGDVALSWYVGLDAEATRIGDALWKDGNLNAEERGSVVALYQLTFSDPGIVLDHLADEPVYLILAMARDGALRMKPQNLVTGLPIRELATAS